MEQAQVFASAWALVGTTFDQGGGIDDSNEEKKILRLKSKLSLMIGTIIEGSTTKLTSHLMIARAALKSKPEFIQSEVLTWRP